MTSRSRFDLRFLGGVGGDPCLLVDLVGERRALLLDIGEAPALSAAISRRTTDLLVSHTHLDHFAGFSRLLRHVLDQDRTIRIFGPQSIVENVDGALSAYTWNYPDSCRITLEVSEWGEAGLQRRVVFRGRASFRAEPVGDVATDAHLLFEDDLIEARATVLDHGIPVLAFALQEAPFFNVDTDQLPELGLAPGPWLNALKRQATLPEVRRDPAVDTPAGARDTRELVDRLVTRTPGCKLAYVTDTLYSAEVERRVAALARDADLFFCEHMFAESEAELAIMKNHLNTRQVGRLAAVARVKEIRPFHFSRRYLDDPEPVVAEARAAWREALAELT